MARLPPQRAGASLKIRHEQVAFSFWPMKRGSRRWGLNTIIYAADPWAVVHGALRLSCTGQNLDSARSFVRQAREYFTAATSSEAVETKPVLFYYSFLNLAKALGIARGRPQMIGQVFHGLTHDHVVGQSPAAASLKSFASTTTSINVFAELHELLTGATIANTGFQLTELMPQSVVGHRLWADAAGGRRERFVAAERVCLLEDSDAGLIWAAIDVSREALNRLGRSMDGMLKEAGLEGEWRKVADVDDNGQSLRRFEMKNAVSYGHRASDELMKVIKVARPRLTRTILSRSPYRKYYLYLAPAGEIRLHPQLVVYALMFYLGSLTRYRPRELFELLDGPFGGFFREFLATQPLQFVYEMACEFTEQEITRAEVV